MPLTQPILFYPDDLRRALLDVGESYEFLRYDCDGDLDEIGLHNPQLLASTALLQRFAEGEPLDCHRCSS